MPPVPYVPAMPRRSARRDHLIVCGDNSLATRVIEELTTTYGQQVTVLLRARAGGLAPKLAALPRVRVIERPELDSDAFAAAGVQSARSLALLGQDDLGNFHAALRAQELNPKLRLVVRIFNTSLGERMHTFFHDCAVLSGSSMAAPSFVAAALGEPAPSHVRVAGRTLYVVRGSAIDRRHVICGLAVTDDDPLSPALLPPDTGHADLVLAVADGAPRDPLTRQRRRPVRALAGMLRRLLWHKLGFAFLGLFALLAAGRPVEDIHQTGQVRVIALQRLGADTVDWAPGKQRLLEPQDRIYVLATRAGLSQVLARSLSQVLARSQPVQA